MTVEEINRRVAEIALVTDPEVAHAEEDSLHRDVLRAIAGGTRNAAALAEAALATVPLGFPRWYA